MPSTEGIESTQNGIRGRDKHVGDLFSSSFFYQVPEFQREFAWEADVHFVAMLEDIYAQYSPDPRDWDEYFLGNLVLWEEAGHRQLIDGQQRMTSVTILLCAIRDRFEALDQEESANAVNLLLRAQRGDYDPRTGGWGQVYDPRMQLLYADSRNALAELVEGKADSRLTRDAESTSVANILECYREASNFLEGNFETHEQLYGFFEFLRQKVTFVEVEAPDDTHAINIFWTMNDRGRQLDAMELLKNLLFSATQTRADWERLATKWKDLRGILESADVRKPVQFLRYVVLSQYDAAKDDRDWSRTKEDNIHRWMKDNASKLGIAANPMKYADELIETAKRYKNLREDKRPNGSPSPVLPNFKKYSQGLKQHFVVLLAAHRLPDEEFDRIAGALENLIFVILFIGSITREIERDFTRWAAIVREASKASDVSRAVTSFIEGHISPELRKRAALFDARFRSASVSDITETRYKYAVAKLAQHVDLKVQAHGRRGEAEPQRALAYYINRNHDLEHILPKSLPEEWRDQFGDKQDRESMDQYVWRFGNLTYLESSINSEIHDDLFPAKRARYPESKFELTKALASLPTGNSARRRDLARQLTYDYSQNSSWTRKDIDDRSEVMLVLAHEVWDLGDVTGQPS